MTGASAPVRQGLHLLLSAVDGWHVEQLRDVDHRAGRARLRRADLLVLDLDPWPNGLTPLRRLALGRGTPIVALVTSATEARVRDALRAGAVACLAKERVAEDLVDAIVSATSPHP